LRLSPQQRSLEGRKTDSEDCIPEGIRVSRTSWLDCRRQRSSQYLECVSTWASKRIYQQRIVLPPPSEVRSVYIFQQLAVLLHDVRPASTVTSSSWVASSQRCRHCITMKTEAWTVGKRLTIKRVTRGPRHFNPGDEIPHASTRCTPRTVV
jgi:hypothetical protein